jgi:lycopene cyclase domain-containing protein
MTLEYLIFNLIIFTSPIIGGLLYKNTTWPKLKPTLIAITIPATLYIIWDILVTDYFWYFNPNHITNIKLANLPIEEILFFFTIPFSCLFLWANFNQLLKNKKPKLHTINKYHNKIKFIIISILILCTMYSILNTLPYTLTVTLVLILTIILTHQITPHLFKNPRFYLFLLITLILTTIFNGYLTARPIVTYNPQFKTNLNIYTIPIEDYLYSLSLITLVISLYEKQTKKKQHFLTTSPSPPHVNTT